jgi:hypothetical protein
MSPNPNVQPAPMQTQETVPAQVEPTQATPPSDPVQVLTQLKSLLDAGLIDQAEFDAKRQEVLSRM